LTSHIEHKRDDIIQWRRSQTLLLSSKGHSQREIAQILHVSNGTVNSDLSHLRKATKQNIRSYIDEKILWEYEKCLTALEAINRKAWEISENTENRREKLQALSLAKECVTTKLDLITNSTIIGEAVSFVEKSKKKLKQLSNNSLPSLSEEESKPNANSRTF
jgi:hypothetical protein